MNDRVTLAHGAGGRQTAELIDKVFKAHFSNPQFTSDDAAVLQMQSGKLAFTTDGFIVSPPFFPGGNIGKLSICGTVNDLSCMGAKPLYLSCAFVIEEGFEMAKLEEIGISENKGVRAGYDNDKSVNYPITEITKMPCVLLDMGYVTSSIDNQLLDANIEAYARAIGNGIIESAVEQGIIDKNGARLVSGQLTSEKAVAGKKPDVSAENDSESRPDESSVPDDESQAEINEWSNYDDPSQNENAADGFEYTDDGVGYYTDPMMTE